MDVTAAVITRADLILACQRRAGGPHAGKWEFPGGKREKGETFVQCLRRELREELAIEAEVSTKLWQTDHRYPGRPPIRLFFFHVPRYRGRLVNLAFADMMWVRIGSLGGLDFLEADRRFITRLDRGEIQLPE